MAERVAPRGASRGRAVPEPRCRRDARGRWDGDARQNRTFAGARLDPNPRRHASGRRMALRGVPEHPGPANGQRGRVPGVDTYGLPVEGFSPKQENYIRVARLRPDPTQEPA